MTPYKRIHALTRVQRNHNYHLSADRVAVENIFARIKGRFRRLIFINAYSIAKCVEVATAACVLHNYCYINNDVWNDVYEEDNERQEPEHDNHNHAEETRLAKLKRDRISQQLIKNFYYQYVIKLI